MSFQSPSDYRQDHEYLLREHKDILKGIMLGKTNNVGTFTLTANSATTTLIFAAGLIGPGSSLYWTPASANAAVAMSSLYQSSINTTANTMTLTHANTATTDRTFNYVLCG